MIVDELNYNGSRLVEAVPGRSPASIPDQLHQPRNVPGLAPTRCPIRITAAFSDNSGSSFLTSATGRIERARSSGGYFLRPGMIIFLREIRRFTSPGTFHCPIANTPAAGPPTLADPFVLTTR